MLGPSFIGYDGCDLKVQGLIEHGRKANSLREYGSNAGPRNAVKPLVPPVVSWNREPTDARSLVEHLSRLFHQVQTRNEVVYALMDG
jgi:hypothetical protein